MKNLYLYLLIFLSFFSVFSQENNASIFIARNNGFAGMAAPAHVFVDYDYVGKLKQNKHFIEYQTNQAAVNVAVVSSLGVSNAITVKLDANSPTYINVNLSKPYMLEDVTHDNTLKAKVIDRVNSNKELVASSSERQKYVEKYKDKLERKYKDFPVVDQPIEKTQVASSTSTQNTSEPLVTSVESSSTSSGPQETNQVAAPSVSQVSDASAEVLDSLSAEDIYHNYLQLIDPNHQLKELSSLTKIEQVISSVGTAGASGVNSNYVNLNLKTNEGKIVGIMKMETMNTKTVFDGVSGYTEVGSNYKTDFTPAQAAAFKSTQGKFIQEQQVPENATVTLVEFNNKEVYSVNYSSTTNGMTVRTSDYYDPLTFEKLATTSKSEINGMLSETLMVYQNYKNYDGLKFPSQILTNIKSTGNNINSTIETKANVDYKFNESFDTYVNQPLDGIASSIAAVPSASLSQNDASFGSIASISGASTSTSPSLDLSQFESEEDLRTSAGFKSLNKREQAYRLSLFKQQNAETSSGFSTSTAPSVESTGERERIDKMDAAVAGKLKYRRSSLYTLMVDDNTREHYNVIKDAFGNTELSEKFNNHNIGPYLIPAHGMSGEKDQTELIEDYLNSNAVARNIVAKWFNRDENGHFDMDLIAERGQYNASDLDVKLAQSSIRGKALLSDAGRELLSNTFVIVYDYRYTNKEEQADKRRGLLNAVTTVASFIPGAEDVATVSSLATTASDVVGKGYFVRTTSYLYRLVWNDEIAQEFYESLWVDESNDDPDKKEAFLASDLFKLEYVGSEVSRNNLQSTIFSSKSNEELIDIATTKAVDKNIGKLQRSYEQFRVKTPLLMAEPIAAKIGLKEDIEGNDRFEVLEQVLNEDGTTSYERVTTIRVDKKHIWDNTYLADEVAEDNSEPYTVFKGNSKKLASGMLIRQLN
jgi:hypothetical protein